MLKIRELEENGSFDSPECIRFLDECDIVVTNPPFTKINGFVSLLVEKEKDFIFIGPKNFLTYNLGISLFTKGKMFIGNTIGCGHLWFISPEGEKMSVPVAWYSSIYVPKTPLILTETYSADKYPVYDNFEAINVDKVKDIPKDYFGAMGVPITFAFKYNPEQFEIIGGFNNYNPETAGEGRIYGEAKKIATTTSLFRGPVVNGKATYYRILIKHKRGEH